MIKKYSLILIVFLCFFSLAYGQTTDLIISEYGEGSLGTTKYIEIYNGTGATVDLSAYDLWRISNGGVWPEATLALSGNLADGTTYVIANNATDTPGADLYNGFCSWNGNDAVGLASSGILIDAVGTDGADPGTHWTVGASGETRNDRLIRKTTVCSPNIDWNLSRGTNDANSEWTYAAYTNGAAIAGHSASCSSCTPPVDPSGSISEDNTVCGESTLSFSGTAPANVIYYWQTPNAGDTDMINDAANTLTVTVSVNYYVRAYNTSTMCWSSGEIGPFTPTINMSATIDPQPNDQGVIIGSNATFSVATTNATAYQWEESTDGIVWTPIGTNSNTLALTSVPISQNGYMYRVTISSTGCPDLISDIATLYVFNNNACVDEDFVTFPGWTNSGTAADTNIIHYGIAAPCRAFTSGDYMITPSIDNPEFLQFYQDASNGGNGNIATVEYRIGAGAWTALHSFAVTTSGNTESVALSNIGGVNLTNETNVTFRFNSTFSTWYLDDVKIFCTPCTPPITTSTISPSSGPIGTYVTISGSDFTGATTVSFNGVNATIISQTASEIVAQVPSGASDGDLTLSTPASIYCDSNIPFDVIETELACQTTLDPIPTDLFIYEVFDENNTIDAPIDYGNGGMITIFNGTNGTKNLSDYRIFRDRSYNAGSPNFVLLYAPTGLLAPGEMFRLKITSSVCTDGPGGYQTPYSDISATGWNADDAIELRTFNTMTSAWDNTIDQFLSPANPGYFYQRDLTDATVEPTSTYNAADWNIDTNLISGNACREVGVIPNFSGGPPSLTQSNTGGTCNNATLTVNANEGYNGTSPTDSRQLNFEWYYYDNATDVWNLITSGGDYIINYTIDNNAGTGTSELQISNVYNKIDYQFYCRVRESDATCFEPTETFLLSVQKTTWTTSWDFGPPNINTIAIIDGVYSTGVNGSGDGNIDACQLLVKTGHLLTVGLSSYVRVVNDVINNGTITVQTSGSFVQDGDDGAAGSFTNSGAGSSNALKTTVIFNDAISGDYNYTYWSSPVAGSLVNTVFPNPVGLRRFYFAGEEFLDSFAEDPGNDEVFNAGQDDIDDDNSDWIYATGLTMEIGRGYAVTAVSTPSPGNNYTDSANFIGGFNTGNYDFTIYRNDNEMADNNWNFTGNPYPSPISADAFILENMYLASPVGGFPANTSGTLDGAIFLWSQSIPADVDTNGNENWNFSQSDYAVINLTGETAGNSGAQPIRYIPSGQGFFVSYSDDAGTNGGGPIYSNTVTYKNSMRVADNSSNGQFFEANEETQTIGETNLLTVPNEANKLWIDLSSDNGIFNQILIGYVEGSSDGFDGMKFDAYRNLSSNTYAALYTMIEGYEKVFTIQAKDPASLTLDEVIPLGFSTTITEPTLYKFSIPRKEGDFLHSNIIFIKDRLLGIIHDLTESDYTFTSDMGEFNNRFEIVFRKDALSLDDNNLNDNELIIIEGKNHNVTFKIFSHQQMKSIEIIDLLGRTIYLLECENGSQITYNLSNLSQATYLAKVTLNDGNIIIKKAVKRR